MNSPAPTLAPKLPRGILKKYKELYKQKSELDKKLRVMKKEIQDFIIENTIPFAGPSGETVHEIKVGTSSAEVKVSHALTLDSTKIKKELPELWEEYSKETKRVNLKVI